MLVFNAVTLRASLIRSLAVVDTRAATVPVINKNWFGLAYDRGGLSSNLIALCVRLLLNILGSVEIFYQGTFSPGL